MPLSRCSFIVAIRPLCLLSVLALWSSVLPPPTFCSLSALLVTPARRAEYFAVMLELCYNAAGIPAEVVAFSSARMAAKSSIGEMCHLYEIDDSQPRARRPAQVGPRLLSRVSGPSAHRLGADAVRPHPDAHHRRAFTQRRGAPYQRCLVSGRHAYSSSPSIQHSRTISLSATARKNRLDTRGLREELDGPIRCRRLRAGWTMFPGESSRQAINGILRLISGVASLSVDCI